MHAHKYRLLGASCLPQNDVEEKSTWFMILDNQDLARNKSLPVLCS